MSTPPLLIFDGDCGICTSSARWIGRRASRITVRSHREEKMDTIDKVIFVDGSTVRKGADAVGAVLRASDQRLLRACGTIISLPIVLPFARAVYWVVARNRSRISRLLGVRACGIGEGD